MDTKPSNPLQDDYIRKATVLRVVDGDTAVVLVDTGFETSREITVRFYGINTPERGQAGYQEAKDHVIQRIEGKVITLQTTSFKKDGFRRYIGVVYIDGICLNDEIIQLGLGVPFMVDK